MAEATQRQPLTDEQLRLIAKSGRADLLGKLNQQEKVRLRSLLRGEDPPPTEDRTEAARRRQERLDKIDFDESPLRKLMGHTPIPEQVESHVRFAQAVLSGGLRNVAEFPGNLAIRSGEALGSFQMERQRATEKFLGFGPGSKLPDVRPGILGPLTAGPAGPIPPETPDPFAGLSAASGMPSTFTAPFGDRTPLSIYSAGEAAPPVPEPSVITRAFHGAADAAGWITQMVGGLANPFTVTPEEREALDFSWRFLDGIWKSHFRFYEDPHGQFEESPVEALANAFDAATLGATAYRRFLTRPAIVKAGEELLESSAKAAKEQALETADDALLSDRPRQPMEPTRRRPPRVREIDRLIAGAHNRLGTAALPVTFAKHRRAVQDMQPQQVLDELASRMGNNTRKQVKAEMKERGLDWGRDRVAQFRGWDEAKAADPGPAAKFMDDVADEAVKTEDPQVIKAVEDGLDDAANRAHEAAQDAFKVDSTEAHEMGERAAELARRAEAAKERMAAQRGETLADDLEAELERLAAKRVSGAKAQEEALNPSATARRNTADAVADSETATKAAERTRARTTPEERAANRQAGQANSEVLTRMATAAVGSTIAGTVFAEEGEFNKPMAVLTGLGGLIFGSPRVFGFGDGPVDLERSARVIRDGMLARMGDTGEGIVSGELAARRFQQATTIGGGVLGASAGLNPELEGDPLQQIGVALLGGAAGAGLGSIGGKAVFPGDRDLVRAWDRIFVELGQLPDDPLRDFVRRERNRLFGRLQEMADSAKELADATDEEVDAMRMWLDGQGATMEQFGVAERHRRSVGRLRFLWDEMARDLVEFGNLERRPGFWIVEDSKFTFDPKVAEKARSAGKAVEDRPSLESIVEGNIGRYVPQVVADFEKSDPLLVAARYVQETMGESLGKLTDGKYLKHRMTPEEVAEAGLKLEKNPGTIMGLRGPVLAADVTRHKIMAHVAGSPDYIIPKGVIDGAMKGEVTEYLGKPIVLETHRSWNGRLEKVARVGRTVYRQLPSSDGAYGVLQGRYVDEGIADFFQAQVGMPRKWHQIINQKGIAMFKASKVVYNPSTLIRNGIGQVILNDQGGVNPFTRTGYRTYRDALRDYFSQGEVYREARASGMFGGDFFGAEVKPLLAKIDGDADSILDVVMGTVPETVGKGLDQMRRFHQRTDEALGKQVMFWHARKNMGLSVDDAVQYAKRYAFDYRDVPGWVQVSRSSMFGAPFVSFSYKALPRIFENAVSFNDPRKMFRFWKYPAALAAFNEWSARSFGDEFIQEEAKGAWDTAKRVVGNTIGLGVGAGQVAGGVDFSRYLPHYAGPQQALVPNAPFMGKDAFGANRAVDLTYWAPWGDIGEVGKGALGRNLAKIGVPFPRQLEPGGPWPMFIVGGFTNRDLFTGRQIIPEEATDAETIFSGANWILGTFGPQWFRQADQARRAILDPDARFDLHQPGPLDSFASMIAIKSRPMDAARTIEGELSKARAKLASVRRDISSGRLSPSARARKAEQELMLEDRIIELEETFDGALDALPIEMQLAREAFQDRRADRAQAARDEALAHREAMRVLSGQSE